MKIKWTRIPVFELITDDGNYDRFVCVREGAVILNNIKTIHFPAGWTTDVTSTPWWALAFVPQLGPHAPAALLHDRLLDLGYGRATALKWMKIQLEQLKEVHPARKWAMILSVKIYDFYSKLFL